MRRKCDFLNLYSWPIGSPTRAFQKTILGPLEFKMANIRHLENCHIAISQRKVVQFRWNLVHNTIFGTWWQSPDQIWKFPKFKMAGSHHIENRFSAITQQPIVRFQWNSAQGSKIANLLQNPTVKDFMKIGQHLPKLSYKNRTACFWLTRVTIKEFCHRSVACRSRICHLGRTPLTAKCLKISSTLSLRRPIR